MAHKKNPGDSVDIFEGLARRAAPSRSPSSSGTRLSAASSPLTTASGPKRTLPGIGDDWDRDDVTKEFVETEEVTHEIVDGATLVEEIQEAQDEDDPLSEDMTKEIPRLVHRKAAAPVVATPRPQARYPVTLQGLTAPRSMPPGISRPPMPPAPPPSSRPVMIVPVRPSHAAAPTLPEWEPAREHAQASRSYRAAPRPGSIPDFEVPFAHHEVSAHHATQPIPRLRPRPALSHIAAACAAAAVVVLLVELKPSQGKIAVNASDARGGAVDRIGIFVDGEATKCATAPCYLPCDPGAHEVKVMADGYAVPPTQRASVKAGDTVALNFVLGSSSGSGLKVSGTQAGVKLFIDRKEVGPLPQIVRDLEPGDHTIQVAGSERYLAIERHVTVERDKVIDLGTINLKVLKGKVTVLPGTPGARAFITSASDRRDLPVLPISLDIDTSKSWSIEAALAGYEPFRQPVSFDDGVADKTFTVTLEAKAGATPGPTPAPIAYEPPQPVALAAPSPAPPVPRAAPARDVGFAAVGDAYLNINSIPSSICALDGKTLGATPRLHVPVIPGSHTVVFRLPEDGSTKSVVVFVGAGETKLAVARLN